jgi:hypothetical protein
MYQPSIVTSRPFWPRHAGAQAGQKLNNLFIGKMMEQADRGHWVERFSILRFKAGHIRDQELATTAKCPVSVFDVRRREVYPDVVHIRQEFE